MRGSGAIGQLLSALPTMINWQIKEWTSDAWVKANLASRKMA